MAYTCVLQHQEDLWKGNSCWLCWVRTVITQGILLLSNSANRFGLLGSTCGNVTRAFRKGGDNGIWHSIQYCNCDNGGHLQKTLLAICYIKVNTPLVCDAIGNSHPLSDRTKLSEAPIPYPEHFVNKDDYEQNSILPDLWMKDVICTTSDWISRGRGPRTITDHLDGDGHETFITKDGIPIQDPARKAMVLIHKVQRFPHYLLDVSNTMIWRIMELAFEPVAPRAWITLFCQWVCELQRIDVTLQN